MPGKRCPAKICKILGLLTALVLATALTGCDEVEILEKPEGERGPEALPPDKLEPDIYYVKDGTKFYRTMDPNGTATQYSSSVDERRILYVLDGEDGPPTHYKGEVVALATAGARPREATLERFKDLGYSFGVYGMEFDAEHMTLNFEAGRNLVEGSSAEAVFTGLESKEIRISTLDGKPLVKENIDLTGGTLPDLTKEEHLVAFYAGTYYHEEKIKADTHLFQSFELFPYGETEIEDTRNGYIAFNTPQDLKSGYYMINGKGFFKYLAKERADDIAQEQIDMNDPYYSSDEERIAAYSRQYSISLDTPKKNMHIVATYDPQTQGQSGFDLYDSYGTSSTYGVTANVKGYVFSPDGTRYEMDIDDEKHTISLSLAEAMPGNWTVNLVPSSLGVTDIRVTDDSLSRQLTQEVFQIALDSPRQNITFRAYYTNDINEQEKNIEINGTVITPSGETWIMEKASEKDKATGQETYWLQCVAAYAPEGEYTMKINHFPTKTTVTGTEVVNNARTNTDVIIIEE